MEQELKKSKFAMIMELCLITFGVTIITFVGCLLLALAFAFIYFGPSFFGSGFLENTGDCCNNYVTQPLIIYPEYITPLSYSPLTISSANSP